MQKKKRKQPRSVWAHMSSSLSRLCFDSRCLSADSSEKGYGFNVVCCGTVQLSEGENVRAAKSKVHSGHRSRIHSIHILQLKVTCCGEIADSEEQKIIMKCWKSTRHSQFVF